MSTSVKILLVALVVATSIFFILQKFIPANQQISHISPNCFQDFEDLIEVKHYENLVQNAIDSANSILGEDIGFRLNPGWIDNSGYTDTNSESIPVHIVEQEKAGKYGIMYVPHGKKCVLVDATRIPEAIGYFSGRVQDTNGAYEPAQEGMLSYLLLHEAGHVYYEHFGDQLSLLEEAKVLCESELFTSLISSETLPINIQCTEKKLIELIADQFTVRQIQNAREAIGEDETNVLRRIDANLMLMTIISVASQFIFSRAENDTSKNPPQTTYFDAGFSHPNTELRILLSLNELDPDFQWILDEFIAGRKGTLQSSPELDFSNKDSSELIDIISNQSEETNARTEAAIVLGERKYTGAVEELIATLDETPNYSGKQASAFSVFRETGVFALGEIADNRAFNTLVRLIGIEDINVQIASADALRKLKNPEAVPILISHLDPDNRMLFVSIIDALGESRDKRAVEPLISIVLTDDGAALRSASEALGKIGDSRAVEPLTEVLKTILDNESKRVITEVLEALNSAARE